jgi:hypothetical protein
MLISKALADRLRLQGKARPVGQFEEAGRTYVLLARLDTGKVDRYLSTPRK